MLLILRQTRRLRATSLKGLPDAGQLCRSYLLTFNVTHYTVVCPVDLLKDVAAADTLGAPDLYEPLGKTFTFDYHLVELVIISRRLIEVEVSQWYGVWRCGKTHLRDRSDNVEQHLGSIVQGYKWQ